MRRDALLEIRMGKTRLYLVPADPKYSKDRRDVGEKTIGRVKAKLGASLQTVNMINTVTRISPNSIRSSLSRLREDGIAVPYRLVDHHGHSYSPVLWGARLEASEKPTIVYKGRHGW